eukprot:UN33144
MLCPIILILFNSFSYEGLLQQFLDSIDVCLIVKDPSNNLIAGNQNSTTIVLPSEYCIEVKATNEQGHSAILNLSEEGIIDGYINNDISINWSEDKNIYESQIVSFMGLYEKLNLGYIAYLKHLYHHWIE